MKKQNCLLFSLTFLCFLTACEDVSSNHKQGQNRNPERSTPEIGGEGSGSLRSHLHREKGSPILSSSQEIQKILNGELPDISYRLIPSMEKDDEGSLKNTTPVEALGRPAINCGAGDGFPGIDARITDCFQKNGSKALWEGHRYGAAGESTWKLVSRNNAKEIWFDMRTGLVWSYLMTNEDNSNAFNWCMASGNTENNSSDVAVDCNDIGSAESLCANEILEEVGSQVKWRLPTRNDYLQADINGIRSIVEKEGEAGLWTATLRARSQGRSEAWIYNTQEGLLSAASLSTLHSVRCIGAPVR